MKWWGTNSMLLVMWTFCKLFETNMCLSLTNAFSFQICLSVYSNPESCVLVSMSCNFSVPSEIITGPNIRFSSVLSGSGVCLFFKALPAWAHQLPGWDATPGSAGQGIFGYDTFIRQVCFVKVWNWPDILWHCVAGYIVVPPFRASGKYSDLLVLSLSESCRSWSKKSLPLSATQQLDLENDPDRDTHR